MKKYINKLIYLLFASFLMLGACDDLKDNPDAIAEPEKKLDGIWMIETISRNNADITALMDFTKFRLHLLEDNTYKVENPLPFLVYESGSWHLDDPQYPFNIIFKEDGVIEDIVNAFTFPVDNGTRRISLTFSPGCYSNRYTYILKRAPIN